MKILAFAQNQWFKNPARMQAMLAGRYYNGDREKFIKTFLFFRCRTGIVLRSTLTEELCDRIIWEEASPLMGDHAGAKFPPDPVHIKRVISKHDPTVILGFGNQARDGIGVALIDRLGLAMTPGILLPGPSVLLGPHPTARTGDVFPRLRSMASFIAEIADSSPPCLINF